MSRNIRFFPENCFCDALSRIVLIVILIVGATGCPLFTSAGTEGPQVSIQNVKAARDPASDLPIVTVDYTVKYPSDLYAQTISGVPSLTCTMSQRQLTQTRTFTGTPSPVTGLTGALQKGQAVINVPADGKFIAGGFSVICELKSDRTLGTTDAASVEISKASEPCPSPLPTVTKKCPWTPEGYSVGTCTTGFCWDGGPQGALACKQEQNVPNSGRTDTNNLVCNQGFTEQRDRCTGVILQCVKQ